MRNGYQSHNHQAKSIHSIGSGGSEREVLSTFERTDGRRIDHGAFENGGMPSQFRGEGPYHSRVRVRNDAA